MFVIAGVIAIAAVGLTACGSAGSSAVAPLSPAASVLDAGYAKTIGFSKTIQAAKSTAETSQKGCSKTIESVFENAAAKTGLVSDVLVCGTAGSATNRARSRAQADHRRPELVATQGPGWLGIRHRHQRARVPDGVAIGHQGGHHRHRCRRDRHLQHAEYLGTAHGSTDPNARAGCTASEFAVPLRTLVPRRLSARSHPGRCLSGPHRHRWDI